MRDRWEGKRDGGRCSRRLDRYRSYDPRSHTWVSCSGNVNECSSPCG